MSFVRMDTVFPFASIKKSCLLRPVGASTAAFMPSKNHLSLHGLHKRSMLFDLCCVPSVLPDLTEYASELILKNASQKGAWENNKKVYSLFVVERDDVAVQSKNVFSTFLEDISGRLLNTKDKLSEGE